MIVLYKYLNIWKTTATCIKLGFAQYILSINNAYLRFGQIIVMAYINKPTTALYQKIVFLSVFLFCKTGNIEFITYRLINKETGLYIFV